MGANQQEEFDDRQTRVEESNAMLNALREPAEETPEERTELLQQLTDHDLVMSDPALQNLLTKDIPSANFSEEQAKEFRHYLDVLLERKTAAFPHEGQDVTGPLREWVHDDPNAGLEPVSKQDLLTDETAKQAVAARITKGQDGSLLRLSLRSIKESVLRRGDEKKSGGGLMGRFRK